MKRASPIRGGPFSLRQNPLCSPSAPAAPPYSPGPGRSPPGSTSPAGRGGWRRRRPVLPDRPGKELIDVSKVAVKSLAVDAAPVRQGVDLYPLQGRGLQQLPQSVRQFALCPCPLQDCLHTGFPSISPAKIRSHSLLSRYLCPYLPKI